MRGEMLGFRWDVGSEPWRHPTRPLICWVWW